MTYSQVLDLQESVKAETGMTGDFADSWGYGDNLNPSMSYGLLPLSTL